MDTDILRMRVQKDLESKYRVEYESKCVEVERMTEAYYELKRQSEIYKTMIDNHRYETDKVLQEMREKHKRELDEVVEENRALLVRMEEGRDRDTVRQMRREVEEWKKRASDAGIENNQLRKERDALKLDRNDMLIKQAKDMEEERNSKRTLSTECDKLRFKLKCMEEDLLKAGLKAEKKAQEANAFSNEKTSLLSLLKEKEILLDSMKRQLNESREDLHQRDQQSDSVNRRQVEDDRDKSVWQRKEMSKLQKEMEVLEQNYMEMEQQKKQQAVLMQEEYEQLQKKHRVITEERAIYLQKVQELERELEDNRQTLDRKGDECALVEREYKKLQDKHRDTLASEYSLSTAKEHLETSMRVLQDDYQRVCSEYEQQTFLYKRERGELLQKVAELTRAYEKVAQEY